MGRVTTLQVRNLANQLLKNHRAEFSANFTKNKGVLGELTLIHSKKIRNKLAGHITHVMKGPAS